MDVRHVGRAIFVAVRLTVMAAGDVPLASACRHWRGNRQTMVGLPVRSAVTYSSMIRPLLACIIVLATPVRALAAGVPIIVLQDTFACRYISYMVRLGLRMAEGDKQAFEDLYLARQDTGACVPLHQGTVAELQDAHDEQGLHLVCIKQAEDPVCFWSNHPKFGPAP